MFIIFSHFTLINTFTITLTKQIYYQTDKLLFSSALFESVLFKSATAEFNSNAKHALYGFSGQSIANYELDYLEKLVSLINHYLHGQFSYMSNHAMPC